MKYNYSALREVISSVMFAAPVTHRTLRDHCASLGLNVSFTSHEGTKAERLREVVDKTPDESLPIVGQRILESGCVNGKERVALQDLLWEPCNEISKRCRRELAVSLEIGDLFQDADAFLRHLENLFATYRATDIWLVGDGIDLDLVEKRVVSNPDDWSVDELWKYLGVFEISSRRFAMLLEGFAHANLQSDEQRQLNFVEKINSRLKFEGFELRQVGLEEGYPEFKLVVVADRAVGKPKNLIFASSEKPDIRFRDAINNDIEIVSGEDKVLVYDRPIGPTGLTWGQLQSWWQEMMQIQSDEEAKASLYRRLRSSLPNDSPPQLLFFNAYFATFAKQIPSLPALLPEVWLHWDAKTVRERGPDALLRSRMDFLLLLPFDIRIVIEIDGRQHYSDGDRADARRYAEMVAADRSLKLDGYHVYRFGGYELSAEKSKELVSEFFIRLFQKFGILTQST